MTLELVEARRRRWKLYIALLAVALVFFVIPFSVCIGSSTIPFEEGLKVLFKWLPVGVDVDSVREQIVLAIRLPRVLMGCVVGAALSLAGAVLQGIFRNPMADPYVIGASSGAALGASLAIVLGVGLTIFGMAAISAMAFVMAMAAITIVYNLSRVGGRVPAMTLLLSGIAVSIFFSAITSLLSVFAGERLHGLYFWLLGSLSESKWEQVMVAAPVLTSCLFVASLYARDLNIMSLGEETAVTLGVDVESAKLVLIMVSSLATSVAVSFTGTIAFVGLMVPHIVRLLVGPDHRVLLPCSALFGATFLVLCDDVVRWLAQAVTRTQIPVGVVTALTGGPFFMYLLRRKRREYAL